MKKYVIILSGFLYLCVLNSCRKKENPHPFEIVADTTQVKALVLCEGNFMWGNADFDVFYPGTRKLLHNVYKNQNSGKPLGDVLESAVMSDSLIWLVLNNSSKMVAINPATFVFESAITGFNSPRYAFPETDGRLWVTDIHDDHVVIVNTKTKAISDKIPCNGWTEQILEVNGEIAVANYKGCVFYFDNTSKTMTDSVVLKRGTQWLALDKNNKLWALAADSGNCYLFRINSVTKTVEKQFSMPKNCGAHRLVLNKNKDSIFYLAGSVFGMPINAISIPTNPIFSESGANFYGISTDPFSGLLYVTDAADYVSNGKVIIINTSGKEQYRFTSGLIPSDVLFYK